MHASATYEDDECAERTEAALRALVCLLARQAAQDTIAKTTDHSAEDGEPGDHGGQAND